MELPKMKKTKGGGMLDGIKAKLGFSDTGRAYDENGFDERDYEDDFGNPSGSYDEYGEYGPSYAEDAYADSPGQKYDPYAPITTRPPRQSRGRTHAHSSAIAPAKLVSIDDVKAHTQLPESLQRDPLAPRRASSSATKARYGDRTMVEAVADAPANTPNARAAAAQTRERTEGLDTLFSTTAIPPAQADPARAQPFDPYDAYAGAGAAKHSPTRSLMVIKPVSYGEVERVAKILKSGDAVVLALRNTPDSLAKRILDFSFGVSSALDASVDCVADKVFAITRGAALSDEEKAALKNQGVI